MFTESKVEASLMQKINAINLQKIYDRLVGRMGFTPERAESAIDGYRKFLYLTTIHGKIIPTKDIDEAWHAHILHLPAYIRDCMEVFGKILWHIPKLPTENAICSGNCNVGDCYPGCRGGDEKETGQDLVTFIIKVPRNEYPNIDMKPEEEVSYADLVKKYNIN